MDGIYGVNVGALVKSRRWSAAYSISAFLWGEKNQYMELMLMWHRSMVSQKFVILYCVCSIFVLERLCACRTSHSFFNSSNPPPPSSPSQKTLPKKGCPFPHLNNHRPAPFRPLPVYFFLLLYLSPPVSSVCYGTVNVCSQMPNCG